MEIFRGRRLWIEKTQIQLPNGMEREKVIVHPGNAVAIFPVDGNYCKLLRQYRYAVGQHIYEAPAGTIEDGEDPLETAHRELCLLYTSPSPRDGLLSRMPSSA